MLSQQQAAWAVYAAFFLLFTLFLIFRCRHNFYLLPFVVFGLIVSIFDICLIAANPAVQEDRDWINKSLALNLLPTISLLIFLGIMESQLIFIRHISSAIESRTSLYLRDPEKKEIQQRQKKNKKRPRAYWASMLSLFLYTALALINLILFLTTTTTSPAVGVATCVSLMFIVVCFNTAVIVSFTRETTTNHVRFIRRNRGDLFFLRVTPLLFSGCMGGMMMLSWVHVSNVSISVAAWIVLESLLVYLPLLCILIMCVHASKFKKMGRQYRMEEDQRSYNSRTFSYNVTKDIENVTKKLSHEETLKVAYPPPPAYKPSQHV